MEDNTLVRTLAYRIIEDKLEEINEVSKYLQQLSEELNALVEDWRGVYE